MSHSAYFLCEVKEGGASKGLAVIRCYPWDSKTMNKSTFPTQSYGELLPGLASFETQTKVNYKTVPFGYAQGAAALGNKPTADYNRHLLFFIPTGSTSSTFGAQIPGTYAGTLIPSAAWKDPMTAHWQQVYRGNDQPFDKSFGAADSNRRYHVKYIFTDGAAPGSGGAA
ncbi:hypothetical protein G647_04740 [Cladophialophora carrionii CBS 160.54]|uniref:Uncharacterized protein n=1 Tax=Cladophialophora carrionii CBS 160.54 TaxID=1279043 RepID=V9D8H0_9EURO|nr:uncharacterized protein G647_04740 [Cladophialophora carrionii CBS 160.54]ETI22946.1 hypothetical protein G647_04740 [Cladophialophora carrionii CBS 160.54]